MAIVVGGRDSGRGVIKISNGAVERDTTAQVGGVVKDVIGRGVQSHVQASREGGDAGK